MSIKSLNNSSAFKCEIILSSQWRKWTSLTVACAIVVDRPLPDKYHPAQIKVTCDPLENILEFPKRSKYSRFECWRHESNQQSPRIITEIYILTNLAILVVLMRFLRLALLKSINKFNDAVKLVTFSRLLTFKTVSFFLALELLCTILKFFWRCEARDSKNLITSRRFHGDWRHSAARLEFLVLAKQLLSRSSSI